jgi:hypothetical protein
MCCTTPEWFYTANVKLKAGMKIPAFFCHSKGWVRILNYIGCGAPGMTPTAFAKSRELLSGCMASR